MKAFAALCDDLTGSSVQSILMKDRGLSVRQIIHPGEHFHPPEEGEVVVLNCDTRRRSPADAASIFLRLLKQIPAGTGIGKRIDTTLRGHLCVETSEILSARPGAAAMVVPAYPSSGRITVGGYHLLSGSLLERTEVSRDPAWPVSSSFVPGYFSEHFKCSLIPMEKVKEGPEAIASVLEESLGCGSRIVVADAMTGEDIEALAEAAASIPREIIPVDPGPFTAAFLGRKFSSRGSGIVLAIIGSTSQKTGKQLEWAEKRLRYSRFDLSAGESYESALARFRDFLQGIPRNAELFLLRPSPEISRGSENSTARTLAALGREALVSMGDRICGILLSGGDTAAVFFEESGTSSLAPIQEIQPLIMGGRILDGDFAGLGTVTKGGLIGEEDGIYSAVRWLGNERE